MDNDNADDEVILQSDSSSESENEFLGFDISDVRGLLEEPKRMPVFATVPKKKSKTSLQGNCDNEDIEGEVLVIDSDNKTDNEDNSSDSELSGELIGSIFETSRKRLKAGGNISHSPASKDSSDESGLDGEIFVSSSFGDERPEITLNIDQPKERKKGQ